MRPVAVAGLVLALSGPASWGESGKRLEADVNVGFFSGDYGGETTTEMQVITPRLRWVLPRGMFRVSFPFLRISDPAGVDVVGGTPVAAPAGQAAAVVVADGSPSRSVAGPGDVRLDGEVDLVRGGERRPWLTGSVRVKIPTARVEDGLGTGETDVEAGLGLTQPVGRNALMLDVRHTKLGESPSDVFRDVTSLGAGFSRAVGRSGHSRIWGYVENRTHPIEGRADRLDVALGGSRRIGRVRLAGAAYVGLSRSAEDFGLSLTVGRGARR